MQTKSRFTMLGVYLAVVLATLLISTQGHGATDTTLYNFKIYTGDLPVCGLVFDSAGNLYGTTVGGGAHRRGAVFELTPNGAGGWNETVLYSFTGKTDGSSPFSNLIFDASGNLYGTAQKSGTYGFGTVFELSPNGAGGWNQSVLYSFTGGSDGANPITGLTMDSLGNLYGATFKLGVGSGTIFELSPVRGGGWAERVIYQASSLSAVVFDKAGNLYGTSAFGGTFSQGYVYQLIPTPNGSWTPIVLYNFKAGNDGLVPGSAVTFDATGNLYGTTTQGGVYNNGTVFKLRHGPTGAWRESVLHSFQGEPNDGYYPLASVIFDPAGNIYGVTDHGGTNNYYGIVFELTPQSRTYKEKVLWNFSGTDGNVPGGNLVLDKAGNLYGTTESGGTRSAGVVFKVTP